MVQIFAAEIFDSFLEEGTRTQFLISVGYEKHKMVCAIAENVDIYGPAGGFNYKLVIDHEPSVLVPRLVQAFEAF